MFGFLIGLPAGTKIELEGAIEPPHIDLVAQDLVDISMENNPDILLSQADTGTMQKDCQSFLVHQMPHKEWCYLLTDIP